MTDEAAITRRVAYVILAGALAVIVCAYVALAVWDDRPPPSELGNLAAALVGALIALAARDRAP